MKIRFEYCNSCDNVEYKEAQKTDKVCTICKQLIYRVELEFEEKKYA